MAHKHHPNRLADRVRHFTAELAADSTAFRRASDVAPILELCQRTPTNVKTLHRLVTEGSGLVLLDFFELFLRDGVRAREQFSRALRIHMPPRVDLRFEQSVVYFHSAVTAETCEAFARAWQRVATFERNRLEKVMSWLDRHQRSTTNLGELGIRHCMDGLRVSLCRRIASFERKHQEFLAKGRDCDQRTDKRPEEQWSREMALWVSERQMKRLSYRGKFPTRNWE